MCKLHVRKSAASDPEETLVNSLEIPCERTNGETIPTAAALRRVRWFVHAGVTLRDGRAFRATLHEPPPDLGMG